MCLREGKKEKGALHCCKAPLNLVGDTWIEHVTPAV